MICIDSGVRITQNIDSRKYIGDYIAYNAKTGGEFKINYSCYLLLDRINNSIINNDEELNSIAKKVTPNYRDIIKLLYSNNIISYTDRKEKNKNILPPLKVKFPLTALALEIITNCNLNCKHCYGQYGGDV